METNVETNAERRSVLTIMQACVLTGVSRRTIYNWIDKEKIEIVRTASGNVRIYEDSLWRDAKKRRLSLVPEIVTRRELDRPFLGKLGATA